MQRLEGYQSRRQLARWLSLMAAVGAVLLLVSLVTPGSALAALPAGPTAVAAALCVWFASVCVARGERISDLEVLVIALLIDAVITFVSRGVSQRPGGDTVLLLLVWPTLIVAVYLRPPLIAAQVIACLGVGVLRFHDLAAGLPVAALQTLVLTSSLAVLAHVVRQLREGFVDAVMQAHREASTDALTGLANRRGITELAPGHLSAAARRAAALEVLVLDIDHFKAVNDEHGHDVGDQVLAQVAGILRSSVRAEDLVGRLGGEEFVILAVVARDSQPGLIGERVRQAVTSHSGPVNVTISGGSVRLRTPSANSDATAVLEGLLHLADQALYESKRAGRNRVTCRSSDREAPVLAA